MRSTALDIVGFQLSNIQILLNICSVISPNRKLKNRVAAQTARDRKKSLMSTLEIQVAQLMEENKRLHRENSTLKQKSGVLVKENAELKGRLGSGKESPASDSEYLGSAVPFVPLPKAQTQEQSHSIHPLATSFLTVRCVP